MPDELTTIDASAIDKLPAIIKAREMLPRFSEQVEVIAVIDDDSNALALALGKAINDEIKAIKAAHDEIVKLTDQAHKAAVRRRNEELAPWQALLPVVDSKSRQYVLEEDRKREAENRRVEIERQREQAEEDAKLAKQREQLKRVGGEPDMLPEVAPPVVLPPVPQVPRTVQVGGAAQTQKRVWRVRPIPGHENEVPDEYCKKIPQQAWLNEALAKGVRKIAGCEVWEDVQTIRR